MDNQPYLIYYQGPANNPNPELGALDRTDSILANIDHIESLPFDGIVVNIPAAWFLMRNEPLNYETYYAEWLRPLEGQLQNLDRNFLLAQIDRPGDPFDDWTNTIENWRKMARAAKEFGYEGIFFDNEEYEGEILNYPDDLNYTHLYSLEQYHSQMRLRGWQIMEAITAEFPDVVLFNNRGPYKSITDLPDFVKPGSSDDLELLGSLFVGFLEGSTPQSTIIDGGQIYHYRTANDFALSYQWRKHTIASEEVDSDFIPQPVRNLWSDLVDVSFGVFNQPHAHLDSELGDMTPAIMRSTLTNALNTGDKYVWLYAERDSWLTPGGVGRAWIDAVAQARNDANGSFNHASFVAENNETRDSRDRIDVNINTNNTSSNSFGSDSNDDLFGTDDSDLMEGKNGFDTLVGGGGNDTILGGNGEDVIRGEDDRDDLFGNSGYDLLFGDSGSDRLVGGNGLDTLVGGTGEDRFIITVNSGEDTIVDFENNSDLLVLTDGLKYEDLKFQVIEGNLAIKLQDREESLVLLQEIDRDIISSDDFISEE